MNPLEVWGGIECSMVRVRDTYRDQLGRTGHPIDDGDLARVAALGVRALRYPVLWEKVAPDGLDRADWRESDRRLGELRDLGVVPIVTLVHHGSGPRDTNLLDPRWPSRLAEFAGAVARRYPWVRDYTPVNEPLTTARFSALYGHWFPHAKGTPELLAATVNECEAVSLAMRAIREVRPDARLVQTEDYTRVSSAPSLAYQAAYENHRRWLSLDLLFGRVREGHALHAHLLESGIAARRLSSLAERATPPDVVGLNYYLTSERYLDPAVDRYPPEARGGNGRDAYADVAAVRHGSARIVGHAGTLEETWARYEAPLAFTEVHLGCTREEQLRWWDEAVRACIAARARGIDVRALTAWALFGSYDWDSLLVHERGHYEPGAFDRRGDGPPRPTALAEAIRATACGDGSSHPTVAAPGWWRRSTRLEIAAPGARESSAPTEVADRGARVGAHARQPAAPLVIVGAGGTLGRAFARACEGRGIAHRVLGRRDLDVTRRDDVRRALGEAPPWAVINAAGFVRVDDAEREKDTCWAVNTHGPQILAECCAETGARFLTFSSDLVFDGALARPYVESDAVAPLNAYGRSKAEAERRVLAALPGALVARTSAFFGPWDTANFAHAALRALARGEPFVAASDVTVSPTYVPDLVHAALDLLVDGASGVWHLASPGAITWAAFAARVAEAHGVSTRSLAAVETSRAAQTGEGGGGAARPLFSALTSERGVLLRPLDEAIAAFVEDVRHESHAAD